MSNEKAKVYAIEGIREYGKDFEGGLKVLKEVANYNREYIQEAVERATELASDYFSEDPDLNGVKFSTPFGTSTRGSIGVDIKRETEYVVPGTDKKIKKSSIAVAVKDPASAMPKSEIRKLSDKLTEKFINK